MESLRSTVARNAAFNILRGCAAAFAALALPHFLTRALSPPRFAAWSLMLQIAAYASFLDFGLQTAVARFVAQALALEQADRRDRVIETALILLTIAAAVAFALMAVVIAAADHLFHGVPAPLLAEFQRAALLLSLGAALSLPLSAFSGVLLGMNRNDVPSLAIGGGRAVGVLLAILAARHTQSLTVLAVCTTPVTRVLGTLRRGGEGSPIGTRGQEAGPLCARKTPQRDGSLYQLSDGPSHEDWAAPTPTCTAGSLANPVTIGACRTS